MKTQFFQIFIFSLLIIGPTAQAAKSRCTGDLGRISKASAIKIDGKLEALLNDIAELTWEYRELNSSATNSEVFLRMIKVKSAELESVLTAARYSDENKAAVKMKLQEIIATRDVHWQNENARAQENELSARRHEQRQFAPFEEDKSSFATNFIEEFHETKPLRAQYGYSTTWFAYPKNPKYFVAFTVVNSSQGKVGAKAVIFDAVTGEVIKEVHYHGESAYHLFHENFNISPDGLNIYAKGSTDGGDWFSMPIAKILRSSKAVVNLDTRGNKMEYASYKTTILSFKNHRVISPKKFYSSVTDAGDAPILEDLTDVSKPYLKYELPKDIGLKHLNHDQTLPPSGRMAQSFSKDEAAIYTTNQEGKDRFISIFKTKNGKYLGSLDATGIKLGQFDSFTLSRDSQMVVAAYKHGFAIWNLKGLTPDTLVRPQVMPFEDGHFIYGSLGFVLSPDFKRVAVVTMKDGAEYTNIFAIKNGRSLENDQRSTGRIDQVNGKWDDIQAFTFTPDGDRIIVIRAESRGGVYVLAKDDEVSGHL